MKPTPYLGKNDERGRSPSIWGGCPIDQMLLDNNVGIFVGDDFMEFQDMASAVDTINKYKSYQDSSVTIKALATGGVGGVIEIASNGSDDDEASIQHGGGSGAQFNITDNATVAVNVPVPRKLWFETRIKKASIADEALGFFVGLAQETQAVADVLVNGTGVLKTTIDAIGFRVLLGDGEEIDFVHQKASATIQEVMTDIETVDGNSMEAATWTKLGFVFDPDAPASERIAIFRDGVRQNTFVTAANIAASTFPGDQELAFLLATKVGESAESKFQMDWWFAAQLAQPATY